MCSSESDTIRELGLYEVGNKVIRTKKERRHGRSI